MYSLLIDTHFSKVTLVLFKDKLVNNIVEKDSNQSHSILTMPLIEDLLKSNNITVKDIKEIYVVIGPGSFTGVRIGVTIAKTMAYCLKIPIKPITSLELILASIDSSVTKSIAINDKNGYFIGKINEKNIINNYTYLSNSDYADYKKTHEVIDNFSNIDYQLVYEFLKNREAVNPHLINPIYVKKIEVQK